MADRTQPLPSHTKALTAVKPNLETRKNHQLDLSGPRRGNRDAEDHHGENRGAEEDAKTTREPQERLHSRGEARAGGKPLSSFSSAAASAGPTCLVSFTGFRDEDEWQETGDESNDAYDNPLAHVAGGDATPCADSLSVCKQLVSVLPGVRVEAKLTSSTTVLVARRGFTKKRLLAARQGIPVVLPKWVAMGCPALLTSGGACGASGAASASLHDLYAVPWLYGYALSTTGLTTSEKAAIDSVCTAHGAVVEPSLTCKCDVLLTSAECVQALQRLLRADREGDAGQRRFSPHLRHAALQRTDAGLMENSGAEMAPPGRRGGAPKATWLTDKVRFALELDVPVVDCVKLFTMLRLDRLPPPTWTRGIAAVMYTSSSKTRRPCDSDAEDCQRQYADALDGNDFDAILDVCRVGSPAGGSSEWTRILSVFADRGDASTTGCALQCDGGVADDGKEGRASPTPLNSIALRGDSRQSSSSCTDSASTVSDPDAWEELLSCALAPSLDEQQTRRADAYPGVSSSADAINVADHLTGTTPTTTRAATAMTTTSPPLQAGLERLTVNTADVEDLANAGAEEPSTQQVVLPDYYSATTGSGLPPRSSSQGCHAGQEVLTATADASWGIAAVDPSPRWTTNALLHREPAPPRQSSRTDEPVACAQRNGPDAAALGQRTAAYWAMHRSTERFQPQLPARDVAPQHAAVMRPDERVAPLSQAFADSGELLAATHDLVESCVAADELGLASAQQLDACDTRVCGATTARQALPLLAMHLPYLTICVLGCTELELRKTARWCEQCRLLRSPVPTSATDIVLLGSRLLTKKRYTMRPAVDSGDDERGTKGGKKQRPQRPARHRSAVSTWSLGENRHRGHHAGHGVAVTIRYWEMDAAVARTLADVCGIPRSRMAPLRWLEDAASAAQKACETAQLAAESEAARRSAAHAWTVDSEGRYTDTCCTAATTPPETLVGLLEERLAVAAESEASAALARQPLFHPLPPLSPDQLPDIADRKYYIRVRQAPATLWASNATPTAAQGLDGIAAGAASADLESRKQVKGSEMHYSARPALGNPAKQPASSSAPVEEDDSLTAATSLSVVSVSAPTTSSVQRPLHEEKTTLGVEDAEHSYKEALETAGRRFTQLIALFRVSGDGDEAQGSAGAAEVDREGRDKVLAACHFCCVEGEYARVDWAVARGLIRYGGGRVEKRAAHDWQTLWQQPQQPSVAVAAASAGAQQDQEAHRRLARALRRGVAYAKLRQKLRRVMGDVWTAHQASRQARSEAPSQCHGAACASADAEQANAAEVARLTAKLQLMSHLCQQAPVLCLLPHSFQRAAGDESGMASAADATVPRKKGLPGRAAAGPASPYKRLHALHYLPAVTMDYVLACIAVGYCLNPHSCFLFDMSIPSAPDMRLFHHQHEQRGGSGALSQKAPARHTGTRLRLDIAGSITPEGNGDEAGQQPHAGAVAAGSGCVGQARAPPYRPALSSWVLERRYSKTDSVGVCISVLWKLPTPPAAEGERCWSRVDVASPPATTATIEPRLTPDASLVPLLRVLLLGLRNAVEALGGHVADTFSPSAVTHVVSVDVGGILSGTLGDAFTSDVVGKRDAVVSSSDGGRPFPYWPTESIESVASCTARDEVSLVGLEWLAACVEWGAFVDETGYAPPADLLALVQVEKQKALLASAQAARTAVHRRAAQAQRPPPPWQSPSHCRLNEHRDHVAAPSPANPAPSGALTAHATRRVPHLERHRKRMGIPPRGASESGAPHTPPHPRLLDYGAPPDRGGAEMEEPNECRTPVLRSVSGASTTWCDSGGEPCTPPVRDAPPPRSVAQHRQQSPPPQPLSSPVPPPPCPQTPSGPHSASQSMTLRAGSTGTPSAGDHGHHRQRRRRYSSSASQHNTRSLLEQQDAEAYVEHLGNLFNFFSPGSTPLPSSAHRWRDRSIAAHADPGAGTPQRPRSPLLPHTPSQSHPPKVTFSPREPHLHCERMRERGTSGTSSSSQCTQVLTPSKTGATLQMTAAETTGSTVGASNVLSTPRRRTLRGAAAATAAYTSSATKNSALSSPDKQRRCTEEVAIGTNSSVADLQRWRALAEVVNGPCDVESGTPDASAPPPQRSTLPNLLGGSTELSRGGTVEAKADGVGSATAISCEEADAKQRQPQGGGCTGSVRDAQTLGELAEGMRPRSIGMAAGTAQQHQVHKRSRSVGGQQDASHTRVQVALDGSHHSGPEAFSWVHDVIPDSQPQRQDIAVVACADTELMSGDVLVPTTFIAATAEAYGPTSAATAETAAGSGHCNDAATPLLAGDCEEMEHEDDAKGVSPAPDAIDTAPGLPVPGPPTATGSTSSLEHKAVRPRLGSCSAPRRPSSPPYPSPPSTTMVADVYGGANIVANAAEEEQRCGAQCAHTDGNAQGLSPWSRHRPLSLSRRPSPSPAPAPSLSHTEPTALGAGTAAATVPRATVATSCTWECLRIYVLHDLPHREARVRRCEEALEALACRRDGVEPRPRIGGGLRTAEPPVKRGDHCGSVDVAPDPSLPLTAPRPAPPLRFVARCEDADVLVTHQINLRESVLVAVAAGCWVVQPGFLECVVAVLDGACCWSDKSSTTSFMRNPWPTLQLQPQRHLALATAVAAPITAAMKASALCVARLRKALPTYEWTAEVLPRVRASGYPPESGSMLPLQRALVQQCRRQRQMREQAAGGSVASEDAGQPFAASRSRQRLFEGNSFVLLSSFPAVNVFPARGTRMAEVGVTDAESCGTSSRVRAIERILETGGGCLCCSVQVGSVAVDEEEKTEGSTDIVAASTHVPPAAQQLLRCCVCAPSLHGQGHEPLRRGLAHTSAPVVMDAALYHDLLWLTCYQVRRGLSETLYVLLDGSLLGTSADDDHAGTAVCVSPAPHTAVTAGAAAAAGRTGEESDNAHLLTTSPLSEHDRISKKRRTEDVEAHDRTRPTAEPASEAATVAAGALAVPTTCTVAAWISSWLLASPNDGSLSKAGDGPPPCRRGYAPAAAQAMRGHLCACCAAVGAVDDDVRVPSSARVSYNVADVPFAVPSVEEVHQACIDVGGGTKAGSPMSASRVAVRRIEFRSTGWVGACVAAGGAAVMAAATDGWMRECEAHTLWGTLFLE